MVFNFCLNMHKRLLYVIILTTCFGKLCNKHPYLLCKRFSCKLYKLFVLNYIIFIYPSVIICIKIHGVYHFLLSGRLHCFTSVPKKQKHLLYNIVSCKWPKSCMFLLRLPRAFLCCSKTDARHVTAVALHPYSFLHLHGLNSQEFWVLFYKRTELT